MFCHPLNNDLSEDYNTRYRKINLKFEMHMKYAFQWYITLRHWQILHFYQNFGVFLPVGASFRGCNSFKWGEIVFFLISCVLIHKCFKKNGVHWDLKMWPKKCLLPPTPIFKHYQLISSPLTLSEPGITYFRSFETFFKKLEKLFYFTILQLVGFWKFEN